MIINSIYKDIVSSFGELWKYKERGKSFEIITPFATTSQKFVSIFLTERDGEFIVSDGGWISEGLYGNSFDRSINCFEKIFLYYQDTFGIKEVKNLSGADVFYKKTDKKIGIPSLVFDMSNFVSTIVSLTNVEYADKETEIEQNFSRTARSYLEKIQTKNEWHFNDYVDSKKEVKVSAIMRRKRTHQLVLFNFITGSNYHYFRSNIGKTNIIFELADKTRERDFIENKIALLDTKARGYSPDHWSKWLAHMLANTNAKKIEWSKKRELTTMLK